MPFRLLADAVVLLHFVFLLFVILGGLFVLWRPRLAWLHVPCAVWGALIELAGWICPLTPLENWLRTRGGDSGYGGGFIEHYVTPVLYPEGLTRELQILLGVGVVALNGAVYLAVWRRRQHRATE
jgi:hypothetical protein